MIEQQFRVFGSHVPQDMGSPLHAAICQAVPSLHGRRGLQISPINGTWDGDRVLLTPNSVLRLRGLESGEALQLNGKVMLVGDAQIVLCEHRTQDTRPSRRLASRVVIYKDKRADPVNPVDADPAQQDGFMTYLGRQLHRLGIDTSQVDLQLGRRRAVSIHGKKLLGFSVSLGGLTGTEQETLMASGLGTLHSFGCGVLSPYDNDHPGAR